MNHLFNEVYDMGKTLNLRNLRSRKLVALHAHARLDDAVRIAKEEMAKQLTYKILESETFFNVGSTNVRGVEFLEYWADCFVLTSNELGSLHRSSFQDGLHHAQQFLRMGQ